MDIPYPILDIYEKLGGLPLGVNKAARLYFQA